MKQEVNSRRKNSSALTQSLMEEFEEVLQWHPQVQINKIIKGKLVFRMSVLFFIWFTLKNVFRRPNRRARHLWISGSMLITMHVNQIGRPMSDPISISHSRNLIIYQMIDQFLFYLLDNLPGAPMIEQLFFGKLHNHW